MNRTMERMRKRAADERGFTMIELLVVVVIIGVLVAIAVPVYLNYRKGAANKSAASDVRGAITAIEQYYTDNGAYPGGPLEGTAGKLAVPGGTAGSISISANNTLRYETTGTGYGICAYNSDGKAYYGSRGSSVTQVKDATSLADCINKLPA